MQQISYESSALTTRPRLLANNRKVKVGNNIEELHFCTCVWFSGWLGILETLSKALILSKSLKYSKLDSLACNYGMRVFAYINSKKFVKLSI